MAVKFRHKETGLFFCRAKGLSPSRRDYDKLGEEGIFRKRHFEMFSCVRQPVVGQRSRPACLRVISAWKKGFYPGPGCIRPGNADAQNVIGFGKGNLGKCEA